MARVDAEILSMAAMHDTAFPVSCGALQRHMTRPPYMSVHMHSGLLSF